MTIAELGLTQAQLGELAQADQALVDAWLDALTRISSKVNSPVGWFLAGVRSGNAPGAVAEPERLTRVRLAETWIRNAGLYEPNEASLVDALFGERGRLRELAGDAQLEARMLALWRHEQPRAERSLAESAARAERWRAATVRAPYAHEPQTRMNTRNPPAPADSISVSSEPLDDADDDIDWAAA